MAVTAGAIEVDGLTIRYGDLTAVDGLSFTADHGQIVALLGPNGAGKTSTVETLEGYKRPNDGIVRVLGLDPVTDHTELTRHIGVMLQQGGVYTAIRPAEVLELFASYYDDPRDPYDLLDRVGLVDRARTPYRRLSGGEQQRLSLALALVGRPRAAFLDEPTAGVDVEGRQLIRQQLAELRDEGVCVLLATHDLDEAERIADRVVIIDRGRKLADGTPADLMSAGDEHVRFGAPPGLDVAELSSHLSHNVTEETDGEYRVEGEASPRTIAALTAWLADHDLPLADLRAGRQKLEDVFVQLTTESKAAEDGRAADEAGQAGRAGGSTSPSRRRGRRR